MVKVILVTGVSRGIGRKVVDNIFSSKEDAVVYGIARSEAPLESIKKQYGDKFFYVAGDVTDKTIVAKLVEDALARHGKIDSIVANAGVLSPVQNIKEIDVEAWKKLYDVNFFSILTLISLTIHHLIKTKGNVILVSSNASTQWYSGWGAYGSSKAALNHLALTVSQEGDGVKAIAVEPGVVDTPMQIEIREKIGPAGMSSEALKMFRDLKSTGALLDSNNPASVYAKLALNGIPSDLNGLYVGYDDKRL
ncbi:probable sepiapterin reductase family protein [Zygosaccharomyces bailii]|nr:probable sepiapterin reductase family protein [Zygosaccharomyces bailii]